MATAVGFLTWQPDMLNERPGSANSGQCGTASTDLFNPNCLADQMTKSSVRTEVDELKKMGSLPSESEAEVAQLKRIEELYRAIVKPITDNEARVLIELLGPDLCFGLTFSFMHLIETAPGWPLKDCLEQLNNEWKIELRDRALRGGHQF